MTGRLSDFKWPGIVALCGTALSLMAWGLAHDVEARSATRRFEFASHETFDDIAPLILGTLEAIQSIGEHLSVTGPVGNGEFHALAAPVQARHPSLYAIQWVPRIARSDRAALEASMRREGVPAFAIAERGEQGGLAAAGDRDAYFPVVYSEAIRGDEAPLGLDLASEPSYRAAMFAAAMVGDIVAIDSGAAVKEGRPHLMAFAPVRRNGGRLRRRQDPGDDVAGYVVGTCSLTEVVDAVMAQEGRAKLDIHIFDLSAPGHMQPIYPEVGAENLDRLRDGRHAERQITVGGRKWLLVSVPGARWHSDGWRKSWLVLIAGLCLTGLGTTMAQVLASRRKVRKESERMIRQERDFTRSVIDSLPGMFYVINTDGRQELWNRTFETMSGYLPSEIAAMPPTAFFGEADKEAIAKAVAEVFTEGSAEVEASLLTKAGAAIPCLFTGRRMDGADGAKLIGMGLDISARLRAEEALRSSEEKLRAMFDLSPLGLALNAMDGRFIEANRAFLDIVGYDQGGLDQLSFWDLTPPDYAEGEARQLETLRATGRYGPYEKEYRHKSGRRVPVRLIGVLIKGHDGQTSIWSIVEDITHRRDAERALEEKNRELARSNAELEQFAYIASHDLREPLRMISAYIGLLERRYGSTFDDDGREFLGFAKEGAERMDRLVLDLLEYSRTGRKPLPVDTVSLSEAVDDAVANLGAQIAETGGRVDVAEDLPTVKGNSGDLVRLFQNLVGNSLKYRAADRPPVVTISAERQGRDWVVSVSDNGIGIDPQYFDRIFMIFQRLHTRDRYDGTGIGLAICRRIAERHGGRIWVESEPGQGATFHVALPAAEGQSA